MLTAIYIRDHLVILHHMVTTIIVRVVVIISTNLE